MRVKNKKLQIVVKKPRLKFNRGFFYDNYM